MTLVPGGPLIPASTNYDTNFTRKVKVSSITDGTATLSNGTLSGLVAPTADSDAVNKAYVDQYHTYENITSGSVSLSLTNISVLSPMEPNNSTAIQTTIGGSLYESIDVITVDSQNNIYTAGYYFDDNKVYNRDGTLANFELPAETDGFFLIKWSENGTALSWTYSPQFAIANAIDTDSNDNLYLTGYYRSTAVSPIYDFSATSTVGSNQFSMAASYVGALKINSYIVKWSSSGLAVSWTSIVGSIESRSFNIKVNSNDDFYASGRYNSTATVPIYDMSLNNTIGPGTQFSLPAVTRDQTMVLKWSSDGTSESWTTLNTGANVFSRSLSFDSSDNLFLGGSYFSSIGAVVYDLSTDNTIGPGTQFSLPATPNSADNSNIFIVSWSTSGAASTWTTMRNCVAANQYQYIKHDNSDNLYLSSTYSQTDDVLIYDFSSDSTTASSLSLPNTIETLYSTCTIKWSNSADSFTILKENFTENGDRLALDFDSSNSLYMYGTYYTTSEMNVYSFTSTGTFGTASFTFSAPLRKDGFSVKWIDDIPVLYTLLQTSNEILSSSSLVDNKDNLYIYGDYFDSTADIQLYNFTSTDSLGTTRGSLALKEFGIPFLKWNSDGNFNLGTYTQNINYTIPNGTSGSISEKNVYLTTANYNYIFNNNMIQPGIFSNGGLAIKFLWNGTSWSLLE